MLMSDLQKCVLYNSQGEKMTIDDDYTVEITNNHETIYEDPTRDKWGVFDHDTPILLSNPSRIMWNVKASPRWYSQEFNGLDTVQTDEDGVPIHKTYKMMEFNIINGTVKAIWFCFGDQTLSGSFDIYVNNDVKSGTDVDNKKSYLYNLVDGSVTFNMNTIPESI